MKQLIGLIALLLSGFAQADAIDTLKTRDVAIYCAAAAQAFHDGIDFRSIGAAKEWKSISLEDLQIKRASGEEAPLDGIYYIGFDKYTEQEQNWIKENVGAGYDWADKVNAVYDEVDAQLATQEFLEHCGYNEAKRRTMKSTDNNMHKTASNQRLITPFSANSPQEEHCTDRAVKTYNACMLGK